MSSSTYTALFEYFKDDDAEGYNVVFPAISGIVTWGRTLQEAKANAKEALRCHIRGLLKDGEPLPQDITIEEPVHVAKIQV